MCGHGIKNWGAVRNHVRSGFHPLAIAGVWRHQLRGLNKQVTGKLPFDTEEAPSTTGGIPVEALIQRATPWASDIDVSDSCSETVHPHPNVPPPPPAPLAVYSQYFGRAVTITNHFSPHRPSVWGEEPSPSTRMGQFLTNTTSRRLRYLWHAACKEKNAWSSLDAQTIARPLMGLRHGNSVPKDPPPQGAGKQFNPRSWLDSQVNVAGHQRKKDALVHGTQILKTSTVFPYAAAPPSFGASAADVRFFTTGAVRLGEGASTPSRPGPSEDSAGAKQDGSSKRADRASKPIVGEAAAEDADGVSLAWAQRGGFVPDEQWMVTGVEQGAGSLISGYGESSAQVWHDVADARWGQVNEASWAAYHGVAEAYPYHQNVFALQRLARLGRPEKKENGLPPRKPLPEEDQTERERAAHLIDTDEWSEDNLLPFNTTAAAMGDPSLMCMWIARRRAIAGSVGNLAHLTESTDGKRRKKRRNRGGIKDSIGDAEWWWEWGTPLHPSSNVWLVPQFTESSAGSSKQAAGGSPSSRRIMPPLSWASEGRSIHQESATPEQDIPTVGRKRTDAPLVQVNGKRLKIATASRPPPPPPTVTAIEDDDDGDSEEEMAAPKSTSTPERGAGNPQPHPQPPSKEELKEPSKEEAKEPSKEGVKEPSKEAAPEQAASPPKPSPSAIPSKPSQPSSEDVDMSSSPATPADPSL